MKWTFHPPGQAELKLPVTTGTSFSPHTGLCEAAGVEPAQGNQQGLSCSRLCADHAQAS